MSANQVWFTMLKERSVLADAMDSMEVIAMRAGALGYQRIPLPYMSTDAARNRAARLFLEASSHPLDVVVMLDCDHDHPQNAVERLAEEITPADTETPVGVVASLAFMRHPPHRPAIFRRMADSMLYSPDELPADGLVDGQVVGHAAIAIARWVFDAIYASGQNHPFWRYQYRDGDWNRPSEDMFFAQQCEACGIYHWCDVGLESPHLTSGIVDRKFWEGYKPRRPVIAPVYGREAEKASAA